MNILNYQDYELCLDITKEFIQNLNESSGSPLINIKPIIITLNMNEVLYDVFNDLVNITSPLIQSLSINSNIQNNIEVNAMLTLGSLMVYYLEERKLNNVDIIPGYTNDDVLRDDIRNILEELKMSGNGNGTVKKISESIGIISNIIGLVYVNELEANIFNIANKGHLNKIIHSINTIIEKYNMNVDQFNQNFTIVNNGLSSKVGLDSLKEIFNKLGISDDSIVDDNAVVDISPIDTDDSINDLTIVES